MRKDDDNDLLKVIDFKYKKMNNDNELNWNILNVLLPVNELLLAKKYNAFGWPITF